MDCVRALLRKLQNSATELVRGGAVASTLTHSGAWPAAIATLGTGDVLVLAEWDRATRSMFDGISIMQRVHARGAAIKVLDKPHLDLTTKIGQGFLAFLSALAEDERERIVKRAADGRKVARAKGVRLGRKPKLTEHQLIKARGELARGRSCRAVAQDLNVHHSTISRLR